MNNNNSAQEVPQWLKANPYPQEDGRHYAWIEGGAAALTPSPAKDEQVREEAEVAQLRQIFPWLSAEGAESVLRKVYFYCDAEDQFGGKRRCINQCESCAEETRPTSKGQAEPKEGLFDCPLCEKGEHPNCNLCDGDQKITWEAVKWYLVSSELRKGSMIGRLQQQLSELESENKQLREGHGALQIWDDCERAVLAMKNFAAADKLQEGLEYMKKLYFKGRTATEQTR